MSEGTTTTHGRDPEEFPGTPQAAAREGQGLPEKLSEETAEVVERVFDVDANQKGVRLKNLGLLCEMPDSYGGGYMRIRTSSSPTVQHLRSMHEMRVKRIPAIKEYLKKNRTQVLPERAQLEVARFTVVMCIEEWRPDIKFRHKGKFIDLPGMDPQTLREWLAENMLQQLDLGTPEGKGDSHDPDFLSVCLDALDEVAKVQAQEVSAVGKDYICGLNPNTSYAE